MKTFFDSFVCNDDIFEKLFDDVHVINKPKKDYSYSRHDEYENGKHLVHEEKEIIDGVVTKNVSWDKSIEEKKAESCPDNSKKTDDTNDELAALKKEMQTLREQNESLLQTNNAMKKKLLGLSKLLSD